MRLPHVSAVLVLGTASLFATPAHAATPTYGCLEIMQEDVSFAIMGVHCESYEGAPTTGELLTEFRIVPNDSESPGYLCRIPPGRTVSGYAGGYPSSVLGLSCRVEGAGKTLAPSPSPSPSSSPSLPTQAGADPASSEFFRPFGLYLGLGPWGPVAFR
jgi:hypothetical protein